MVPLSYRASQHRFTTTSFTSLRHDATQETEIVNSTLTFTSPFKKCIESVISNMCVSPPEQVLWSNALLDQASKYPYLQECPHSLAALIPEYLGSYVNSN
jgi:hypothetical protein